jgi:hypothetical protein
MCQNLDLRLLIFYCFLMLVFFLFIRPLSPFYVSIFIASPPFCFFIALPFSPFFTFVFVSVFRLLWVSSLAYSNLLGTKRLDCCTIPLYIYVWCTCFVMFSIIQPMLTSDYLISVNYYLIEWLFSYCINHLWISLPGICSTLSLLL